jgi:hypothetical protein
MKEISYFNPLCHKENRIIHSIVVVLEKQHQVLAFVRCMRIGTIPKFCGIHSYNNSHAHWKKKKTIKTPDLDGTWKQRLLLDERCSASDQRISQVVEMA